MRGSEVTIQGTEAQKAIAEVYRVRYEALMDKVHSYYREELKQRGDKNLDKEYCDWFGIEQ
jgi:hypothetical protein